MLTGPLMRLGFFKGSDTNTSSSVLWSLHVPRKTNISTDKVFHCFECRWNNAVLAANGRPRGHNYSIWRRLLSPQPWQVTSNVIVRWKTVPCFVLAALTTSSFSILFSCWEEHGLTRTKASPVNISHWLGQPDLPLLSLSPLTSPIPLLLCQSFILGTPILFQPPLPQTLPHLSIHPSIHLLSPSIYLSFLASFSPHLSPSFSLSLLCISLSSCLPVRTQQKCPEGLGFKHRNQKHMAHFQLPRSITAIYPEIAAKFPKVSSRFTTDCNVCLSHFENQATFLAPLPRSLQLSINYFKGFSSGF